MPSNTSTREERPGNTRQLSYLPLEITLVRKNVNRQRLREAGIVSGNTLSKIKKGEYLSLDVIERLCRYLDCDIQDVVQIQVPA
jgi:putative transcriptional regulator